MSIEGVLTADHMKYEFPRLYYKNARGGEQFWQIFVQVLDESGTPQPISMDYMKPISFPTGWMARVEVHSGVVGGKVRATEPDIIREGKNIGKKNSRL